MTPSRAIQLLDQESVGIQKIDKDYLFVTNIISMWSSKRAFQGRPCSFPFVYMGVNDSVSGSMSRKEKIFQTNSLQKDYEKNGAADGKKKSCKPETTKTREELTFTSCTSLDDVTPWCYTRIQVEKSSQFQKNNMFWISGRPAGPRRLLGLLLPLLLRGAALPDQQVKQHRTKPLATLPRPPRY